MSDPGGIILLGTEDGQTRIDVRLVGETVWPSAVQITADAACARVEVHFDEAVQKAKQLAQPKKRTEDGK